MSDDESKRPDLLAKIVGYGAGFALAALAYFIAWKLAADVANRYEL